MSDELIRPGDRIGPYIAGDDCSLDWCWTFTASDERRTVEIRLLSAQSSQADVDRCIERIEAVARAISALEHPAIRRTHEIGQLGMYVWIATDLAAGDPFTPPQLGRPRPWREAIAPIREITDALAATHTTGLGALDLVSTDVMWSDDGRVSIDVTGAYAQNIARCAGIDAPAGSQLFIRSPIHVAPELWAGERFTPLSDQFALCAACWHELFGAHPFEGDTIFDRAEATSQGLRRPPPADVEVPLWLVQVLERGLAAEPNARWPSFGALHKALAGPWWLGWPGL